METSSLETSVSTDESEVVVEKRIMDTSVSTDENDVEMEPADQEDVLHGWTREDKYTLLQGLKFSESNDIERLQLMLPSKTVEEISEAIAFYKKKAMNNPMIRNRMTRERKALDNVSLVPLAQWSKLLTDSFSFEELETETTTALRLIAEFDNIPRPVCTGNVDFKAIYHAIANAIEGKGLPDDKMVNAILEKCIIETAYTSKAFIRATAFKNVLQDINLSDKGLNVFPRPTENHELGTLRHLASQRRYNPLNISEEFLKPSVHN